MPCTQTCSCLYSSCKRVIRDCSSLKKEMEIIRFTCSACEHQSAFTVTCSTPTFSAPERYRVAEFVTEREHACLPEGPVTP